MRFDRLLAGLCLAMPLACVTSSASSSPSSSVSRLEARAQGEVDVKVMTFNIQSGLRGLDKVAEVIRAAGPDIVALQEVDVGSVRAGGANQPERLAALTGLVHHAHFRTTTLWGGDYGVGLLSRFPVLSLEQHPLPVAKGAEPRTVAHAVLDVEGQEVSVYVTHLTRRPFNDAVRIQQSTAILALMARDTRPKLLMGDLNDTPESTSLRLFKRQLHDVFALRGVGPAVTYPLPVIPSLRLDYVLACGQFVPRHGEVLHVNASDHYPVVAQLTLRAPALASAEASPAEGSSGVASALP
jgi:endonuclease/exonuclease/phosphatase family metal-dependent hydrolase